jgi:hypothetical protein
MRQEGVFRKLSVSGSSVPGLVVALRARAGFSLDECCASCGGQFYSREGSPVCFGCVRGDDYQLLLVRKRLLRALGRRQP